MATLGTYTFLSWLRRGISTEIIRKDDGTIAREPRAKVAVWVEFNKDTSLVAEAQLELHGPGEIIGFDQRAVIRTAPGRDVFNSEPNFFPMIEFNQPDLPWLYTPATVSDTGRLRPWLCLIVLKDDEFSRDEPRDPKQPFPSVTVESATPLPDLSQSWAWAHAHLNGLERGGQEIKEDVLADLLAKEPHRLTSRLLCPRRLSTRTAYTAMLVPAFERGRLRGLGQEPDAMRGPLDGLQPPVDGLQPSWGADRPNPRLPIYYEWRFQTGEQGDFEFLVRQLKANRLPATVGIRPMDVSQPGMGLPGASTEPLGLEGALKTAATETTAWNKDQRHTFIEALRAKVNQPVDLMRTTAPESDPSEPCPKQTVAPPLYGRWHAAKETLDEVPDPGGIGWFEDLNSDSRLRVTAGLGTQVVQSQQRQLLEGAWQQVGEIRKANEKLRLAQLARELAVRINQRHIATADQESMLLLTAPLQGRVAGAPSVPVIHGVPDGPSGPTLVLAPKTIRALALGSPIAKGAFDAALRRIKRPRGPFGRRQGRVNLVRDPSINPDILSNILRRMDVGEFSPAPVRTSPPEMTTPARVGQPLVPPTFTRMQLEQMSKNPRPTEFEADLLRRAAIRDDFTITVSQIQRAPRGPDFVASVPSLGARPSAPAKPPAPGGNLQFDSQSAVAFRSATAALLTSANARPEQAPDLITLNVASTKSRMMSALDPNLTIPANISARVNLTNVQLEPIGAAPEFNQPMYEALSELSQDWLLPGLDQVPPNTVALLVTNQRFIEAYMVGLNHEMARELLFHEYPLRDQRGTYFRQFWSVAGHIPEPGMTVDPGTLKDIHPIHEWGRSTALGKNSSRQPPPDNGQLVLLLRGELLRRYPDTIVYAAKAGPKVEGKHTLPNRTDDGFEERYPIFSGILKPDVSFFGFNLTLTDACREPGWFIVLKEHPTGPRFGLDENRLDEKGNHPGPLTEWRDLSWDDLMNGPNGLAPDDYIDLAKQKPDLSSNPSELAKAVWQVDPSPPERSSTAADLAYITLQLPVRIAIHACDLLPCPKPKLTGLSPNSALANGSGFTLTVEGDGFVPGVTVRWNGSDRPTIFVSETHLRASIPPTDTSSTGIAKVSVSKDGSCGGTSNELDFAIVRVTNPIPKLTAFEPSSVSAGGAAFKLKIIGSDFVPGSVVRGNGVDRPTTFVSSTELRTDVTARDIATARIVAVTVFNPAPGGGLSNALSFTILETLTITTRSLPDGKVNIPYAQTLKAIGGTQPYSWEVESGGMPPGLGIDRTGKISGTPGVEDRADVTFKATDAASPPQTATVNLTLTIASASPVAVTFTPPTLTVNIGQTQNFRLTLSAPAPTGGVRITTRSSNARVALVPRSVTFPAGAVTAILAVTGVAVGTAVISASAPGISEANANVTMVEALTVTTRSLPDGKVNIPYETTLKATGGTQPYSWEVESGGIPPGLRIDRTGRISGTPRMEDRADVTFKVTDAASPTQAARVNLTWRIAAAAPLAVTFTPSTLRVNIGQTQNFRLTLSAPAPAGGVRIAIRSSNASVASVPQTVTFPAGAASATLTVAGVTAGTAVISASGRDITEATANVTINANQPAPSADLMIRKIGSFDRVVPGQTVTYTIAVTNPPNGSAAVNVKVTDAVPANTTFLSARVTSGAAWTQTTPVVGGTGTVIFSKASVAAGEAAEFQIVVKVNPTTTATTISNTATVSSTTSDPNTANNTVTVTTKVNQPAASADLRIAKTDAPDPVVPGQTVTYTLTVTNPPGGSAAQTVTVTDAVPANTTFVAARVTTGTGWTQTTPAVGGAGSVVFSKASVAAGETAEFQIVVKVNPTTSATTISNTATVSSTTSDPNTANNKVTVTTNVNQPPPSADLRIAKSDAPDPVMAGQTVTYALTVTNPRGGSAAQTVTVTDAVPANTTFVSARVTTGTGWTQSTPAVGGTGTVFFSKASVAAGETAEFQIVVKVSPNAPAAISNTATVSSPTSDPNTANNTVTVITNVNRQPQPAADLRIAKSATPNAVATGGEVNYRLTVTNDGPATATNVTVTDTLPALTRFGTATVSSGSSTHSNGVVTWKIGNLAAGATATMFIVARVIENAPSGAQLINTATVTSATHDPNTVNNTVTVTTSV